MVCCRYATRFIEMVVMLCADHGPAVSGIYHIALSSLCCPLTCLPLRVHHAWHFEWYTVHLLNAPAIVLCTFAVLACLNLRQNICL